MKKLLLIIISIMLLTSCSTNIKIGSADEPTDIIIKDDSSAIDDFFSKFKTDDSDDSDDSADKNAELLNLAVKAMDEFYVDGMTDYEICIAAHDWIVTHVTYDKGALNILGKVGADSDTAYGALTTGEAICSGYADTFKLFMDLLEVENKLVIGQASGSGSYENHRWNMVCIDGNWYHIDCTWDDYVPDSADRPALHMYMFLSDEDMEYTAHYWDKDEYPQASSNDINFYKTAGLYVESASDVFDLIDAAKANSEKHLEVALPYPFVDIMVENTSMLYTYLCDYYVIEFEFL